VHAHFTKGRADLLRLAARGPWSLVRGRGGCPLPARRAPRESVDASGRERLDHADDGRGARPEFQLITSEALDIDRRNTLSRPGRRDSILWWFGHSRSSRLSLPRFETRTFGESNSR